MSEPTRVVLVDDHALFREGLAALLGYQDDFRVVGQASNARDALRIVGETHPDLVLLDVSMPGEDGLWALQAITAALPAVRVVMLTVHESDEILFEAIKSGAQGYLLKNVNAREMLDMLRGLAQGEAAISRATAARVLREFARQGNTDEAQPPAATDVLPLPALDAAQSLSLREREILELVAARATNKEIAHTLSLSEHTVKNHLRNIMTKLHASSRAHAASFIRQPPH